MAQRSNGADDTERLNKQLLDFVLSLAQRVSQSSDQPGGSVDLCLEIQNHLVTLRTASASFLDQKHIATANELDNHAISLWNITTRLKRTSQPQNEEQPFQVSEVPSSDLIPLLRAFTFHFLDSIHRSSKLSHPGLDKRKTNADQWKDNVRLLRTALKAAKDCTQWKHFEHAAKVLERAADFQAQLGKLSKKHSRNEDPDGEKFTLLESLRSEYLGLRMTFAWRQGNLDMADMMFKQVLDQGPLNDSASAERLADLVYEIGRDLFAKGDCYLSTKWLEKGHGVLGGIVSEQLSPDGDELRLSIAHALVRARLGLKMQVEMDRARDTLEWMDKEYPSKLVVSVLKLDLLSASRPFDSEKYFDALSQLMGNVHLTSSNFSIIMNGIRTLKDHNAHFACKALDDLLVLRLLESDNAAWIQKAFITRLWISTEKLTDAEATVDRLRRFMSSVQQKLIRALPAKAAHAAQTLIWKRMDAFSAGQDFGDAATWGNLAMHPLLAQAGQANAAKIARKIMSCSIACGDHDAALTIFNQMSENARNEPLTRYLVYKVALGSKDEELAVESFELVAKHAMQSPTLLYACVLEAQQSGNRLEAIKALQAVIARQNIGGGKDSHHPSLLRCTVKLLVAELPSSDAEASGVPHQICQVFKRAESINTSPSEIARTYGNPQHATFEPRELDWFAVNSYNLSVKYFADWEPRNILTMLEACVRFSVVRSKLASNTEYPITEYHRMICHGLAAQTSLKIARIEKEKAHQLDQYRRLRGHVQSFTELSQAKENPSYDTDHSSLRQIWRQLILSDFEAVIRLELWDHLNEVIDYCRNLEDSKVYRKLADVILSSAAPAHVIIRTLQHIIAASNNASDNLSVADLARWFRILYQLSQRAAASAVQRIGSDESTATAPSPDSIVSQILQLLRSTAPQHGYPGEELEFLAIATFNRAVDAYVRGDDGECQGLGEVAAELAGFMDDEGCLVETLRGRMGKMLEAGEDGHG